ncbi:UNVERIFIED_CONTAM: hypothetical protein FKN15_015269 [Acipenser sinensis]
MSFHDCVRCGASLQRMATICAPNARVLIMADPTFCAVCASFQKKSRAMRAGRAEGRSTSGSPRPLLTLSRSPLHLLHLRSPLRSVSRFLEHKTKTAKKRRHSPSADVSALRAQMKQQASTVANQQSLLESLVNLTAPPAPTPAFGVLETLSSNTGPSSPSSQLIEEEQDDVVSLHGGRRILNLFFGDRMIFTILEEIKGQGRQNTLMLQALLKRQPQVEQERGSLRLDEFQFSLAIKEDIDRVERMLMDQATEKALMQSANAATNAAASAASVIEED